jgi:hypothetical protein
VKTKILLPIIIVILFSLTFAVFNLYYPSAKLYKQSLLDQTIYLNSSDTSRAVTLKEMGIGVKFGNIFHPVVYYVTDQEILNKYISSLENEYQFLAKNTIISFEDYSFRVPSDQAIVKIDRTQFQESHLNNLLNSSEFKIKLEPQTVDNYDMQLKKTTELIDTITKPLLIKYGRTPMYIPQETLKNFISLEQRNGSIYSVISKQQVSSYLDGLNQKYKTDSVVVLHEPAVDSIRRALLFKAANYQINNAVILPLEGKPKTNGEKNDVYLEVVKSQQRLYRFERGKLVKTYIVSTGLTWETPPGNYSILAKQKMTISYHGSWYMPDYLPIGYIDGAYRFGFHAIPYHMDGAGNIFSRDPNTMGSPATGGCIQLAPDDAKELFNWAWVGIPVYVYEN